MSPEQITELVEKAWPDFATHVRFHVESLSVAADALACIEQTLEKLRIVKVMSGKEAPGIELAMKMLLVDLEEAYAKQNPELIAELEAFAQAQTAERVDGAQLLYVAGNRVAELLGLEPTFDTRRRPASVEAPASQTPPESQSQSQTDRQN